MPFISPKSTLLKKKNSEIERIENNSSVGLLN